VPKKPNILILWGDDIGISNISRFSDGLVEYRTPNIDLVLILARSSAMRLG
jgi:arylsulfatase A-like enzyme